MAKTRINILCGLGFLGLVSIVCQGIGFFYPTWMTFSMSLDVDKLERTSGVDIVGAQDMDLDVNMGLWTINACFMRPYDLGKQCASVSTAELMKMMSSRPSDMNTPGNDKVIGDWLIFQVLAVAAAFFAGVGFCAVIALARATDDKLRFHGCITLFTWVFSAGLILIAVGKRANDNSTYASGTEIINQLDMGVSMEFHTPWAIVASGLGGAAAGIVAVVTVSYLICRQLTTPGQPNTTVVSVEQQPVQIALLDRKADPSDYRSEKPMLIPAEDPPKYTP